MASKEDILKKIKSLLTKQFDSPESAFNFFDENGDGALNRKEIRTLLQQAEISRFIAPLVADKMMTDLDKSTDEKVEWSEFKKSVDELMKKA